MDRLHRLLLISFLESFTTVLVERGVYFYSKNHLGFDARDNLWLALGIGVCYVCGALISHRMAQRLGERKYLLLLLAGHFLCHSALAIFPTIAVFLPANFVLAILTGSKWPLFESYVSAGRNARQTANAIGKFNMSWAISVPLAMASAGQLIVWWTPSLFAVGAIVNLVSIGLVWPLEKRPVHLADDHPDRLPESQLARFRVLVVSGRWSMMASYTLLFVLVPLMPTIFMDKLGLSVQAASALGALVELIRAAMFTLLFFYQGWHGKAGMLVWAAIGLPVGFFLVLFSPYVPLWFTSQQIAAAILGEILFGAAAGAAYYAALYYAMVASASVESGSEHESLVGSGFALGPAAGLVGNGLAGVTGGAVAGMLTGVGPVVAVCFAAALWPMRKLASGSEECIGDGTTGPASGPAK